MGTSTGRQQQQTGPVALAVALVLALTMTVAATAAMPAAASVGGSSSGHGAPEVATPHHQVHDQTPRLQKRSIAEEATQQELSSVLRDAIIARLANEIQVQYPEYLREVQDGGDKKKRMFVPLSGLPGELPTIK